MASTERRHFSYPSPYRKGPWPPQAGAESLALFIRPRDLARALSRTTPAPACSCENSEASPRGGPQRRGSHGGVAAEIPTEKRKRQGRVAGEQQPKGLGHWWWWWCSGALSDAVAALAQGRPHRLCVYVCVLVRGAGTGGPPPRTLAKSTHSPVSN
ncbi:hypothetical protein TraAM80_04091 [Trypanosoma rangeli]|uniref:Uncharacterized protein n=1 Tax=Trypanosoma rangeli TaxID=5698 RepID=A0A422NL35_TRYRA|nr:uncharacterized protein TraAM80_04091 [Trypanosoma rangeli]RNF06200.1 hypothetical protein TraAM80_04091 [Trypanosoma rangeli]|eukprot:RNF06200.1 hypothetical protein TraAM80_04091 [Trypanosoma rangeli]